MQADVAVIGAGPAGLKAAISAGRKGASVVVFDEDSQPGGRLRGQLHEEGNGWWNGLEEATRLTKTATNLGVRFVSNASVWGLEPGWSVHIDAQDSLQTSWKAKAVVLATGAAEQALPLPGWTLPGVMTAGAAQVFVNVHGVLPGRRVLVVGFDILGIVVAQLLQLAGAEVVAVCGWPPDVPGKRKHSPEAAIRRLSLLAGRAAPSPLLRLGGRLGSLSGLSSLLAKVAPARLNVLDLPLWLRWACLELRGNGRVEEAVLSPVTSEGRLAGGETRVENVDAVCLAGGLHPLVELASVAGCEFVRISSLGGSVPLHGPKQQTTVPGLFVAGNVTGVEGAPVCSAQGRVAGLAAAQYAGTDEVTGAEWDEARQAVEVARHKAPVRFRPDILAGRQEMEQRWSSYERQTHHRVSL